MLPRTAEPQTGIYVATSDFGEARQAWNLK